MAVHSTLLALFLTVTHSKFDFQKHLTALGGKKKKN